MLSSPWQSSPHMRTGELARKFRDKRNCVHDYLLISAVYVYSRVGTPTRLAEVDDCETDISHAGLVGCF